MFICANRSTEERKKQMQEKQIVEINGVKVEVDMRTAKRVDTFRVGDNVKVMSKTYDGKPDIKPGIIVDFANFKDCPCIVVAVFNEGSWSSSPSISFINIYADSDCEIIFASEEEIRCSKDGVIEKFEREIQKKKNEYTDLQNQLEYFKKHFLKTDAECREEVKEC